MFVVLPRTPALSTTVASVPGTAVPATTSLPATFPAPSITSLAPQINATAVSAPASEPASEIFTGYISDISSGDPCDNAEEDQGNSSDVDDAEQSSPIQGAAAHTYLPSTSLGDVPMLHQIRSAPPLRCTKFAVPQAERRRVSKAQAVTARANILASSLTAIDKLIASKKNVFHAGNASLQSYRACSIQSHLHMVVKNQKAWKPASDSAAEVQGFAIKWGGRMVRKWTRNWISDRVIPESNIGKHGKSYSLCDDPIIRAELRPYVRSEKWAMDPAKLVEFSENKMVGRRVSLRTARRLLRRDGFTYTEHKKGLYYDGHERPDVVDDRQNRVLPAMAGHRYRLVEYKIGDVEVELDKMYDGNYVLHRLVLALHDEMTAQYNDGPTKSWVLEGEQPLRKKGVGRGLHRSDVICSTVGYITETGEELEYGKSYEGYWDGTKFMVQLKDKIIPAFEAAHGPGYQMLLMVDHSQGHCMYRLDALLVSRMNLNPGSKQAYMRDGWWMDGNTRRIQKMIYPADHPHHPGLPKGIKAILQERRLWPAGKFVKECKKGIHAAP
ncbi:hypothetical protein MVEN_00040000 [Mycena venus]|uniref:Uncharacterized protein n=1 Tax=Mycena venus TaxID=2733690 RepID=A0A8H7DG29_9AGAR|nr:hypothetical protein MVEN_00040000 [Mycena venus]